MDKLLWYVAANVTEEISEWVYGYTVHGNLHRVVCPVSGTVSVILLHFFAFLVADSMSVCCSYVCLCLSCSQITQWGEVYVLWCPQILSYLHQILKFDLPVNGEDLGSTLPRCGKLSHCACTAIDFNFHIFCFAYTIHIDICWRNYVRLPNFT